MSKCVTCPDLNVIVRACNKISVYQYSFGSEKCDGHDSDHDENGNNNVQVSASICFDSD